MSTLIVSALAAAAFAAVPPSIGSEPVPANFDHVAAPAQQVVSRAPGLDVSLGSEPLIVAFDETASPGAPQIDERRSDERLACTCARR